MKSITSFLKLAVHSLCFLVIIVSAASCSDHGNSSSNNRSKPNFLFIISDDQSWEHTSFSGYPLVKTPNFDKIAHEGIYFENAYAAAPSCTASRSAILAGQHIWRLGSSALLHGEYSSEMISFQQLLAESNYNVGYTGKGWGPGYIPASRKFPVHPAGATFNRQKRDLDENLSNIDLVGNFKQFLDKNGNSEPFSFWVGAIEPHRPYADAQSNRFEGDNKNQYIPGILPHTLTVQKQLSSYLEEIEHFDNDVGELLSVLEKRGILNNTVVVITSDNGMAFSRAKTTNYQYGVRVPFAVLWDGIDTKGRIVKDFINLADVAPTLLSLAGVNVPDEMTGNSFIYVLKSDKEGYVDENANAAFTAYERHAGYIRDGESNLTYPRRAIHTENYAYIKNYFPQRWPAGDPPKFIEAYPSLLLNPITGEAEEPYFSLATQKKPREELYDLINDPYQRVNLANQAEYADILRSLSARLEDEQLRTNDPLEVLGEDIFQHYRYY